MFWMIYFVSVLLMVCGVLYCAYKSDESNVKFFLTFTFLPIVNSALLVVVVVALFTIMVMKYGEILSKYLVKRIGKRE